MTQQFISIQQFWDHVPAENTSNSTTYYMDGSFFYVKRIALHINELGI